MDEHKIVDAVAVEQFWPPGKLGDLDIMSGRTEGVGCLIVETLG